MEIEEIQKIIKQYKKLLGLAQEKIAVYTRAYFGYDPDLIENVEIKDKIKFKTVKFGPWGVEWEDWFRLDLNILTMSDEEIKRLAMKKLRGGL